jgi:hypothetical protein
MIDDAMKIISAAAVDLVLVDYCAGSETLELIDACTGTPCVVMAETNDSEMLFDLVCSHQVGHVLCAGGEGGAVRQMDARQIVVTVEKILRSDVFGIEKYTGSFCADISTLQVTEARMRDEVVGNIREYAGWLGCGRELSNRIGTVADELITNAVYNAPRDEHGAARYASTDRREKIVLDPWEYVQVRFASNGEVFALSVTDWFGGLSAEQIRKALTRCLTSDDQIEQKDGGAGLGLYTAFRLSNQLVVNVELTERTEIIAVFELGSRMRGDKTAGQSLQLFTDEARPLAVGSSTTNPTVEFSDSMRVDLRTAFVRTPPSFLALTQGERRHSGDEWDEPSMTIEPSDTQPMAAPLMTS